MLSPESPRDVTPTDQWGRFPPGNGSSASSTDLRANIRPHSFWNTSCRLGPSTISVPDNEQRMRTGAMTLPLSATSPHTVMPPTNHDQTFKTPPALEEWRHSVLSAKVDLSMYLVFSETPLFSLHYLDDVAPSTTYMVTPRCQSEKTENQITPAASKRRNRDSRKPPYTYPALVAAAIYMSGKDSVTVEDVQTEMCNMFPVFRDNCKAWRRQWQKCVCRVLRSKLVKTMTLGLCRTYSIDPDYITKKMFLNVMTRDRCNVIKSHFLYDRLGEPTMFDDLKCNRRRVLSPALSRADDSDESTITTNMFQAENNIHSDMPSMVATTIQADDNDENFSGAQTVSTQVSKKRRRTVTQRVGTLKEKHTNTNWHDAEHSVSET